jgi:acyl carrier protein
LAEDDTVDAMEVILNLEEEFDIEIKDEVAAQLFTVEQAVNYIHQSISEPNNAERWGELGC